LDIQNDLSEYNFVDVSKILWSIRKIKSEIEINNIKEICSITSKVFDNFPQKINLGMSEKEIASIFKKELIESGADYIPYMACASGLNGYNQIICNPTGRVTKDGDILIIDTGATLNGYFSDFDRNFGFGRIHKKVLDAYNKLWEATERTLEIIKPGTSCSEIYSKLSYSLTTNNISVGRMGHGLGLQLTEPPSIMKNDKTLLEENMIITLEPSIEMDENKILVQEENLLITNNVSIGRMGHGLGLQLTEPPSIMKNDKTLLEKNMIITLEPSIEMDENKILVHEENLLITKDSYKLLSTRTPENLPIIN
jgi:Xaa-Pro aminopeptidase